MHNEATGKGSIESNGNILVWIRLYEIHDFLFMSRHDVIIIHSIYRLA